MIYLNGSPLSVTMFPDNTSQVWHLSENLLKESNWFHISWDFSHENEFLHIAQLKHLLDSYGHRSALRIKYLPYGRQDKEVGNNATFALRTFANLLNTLHFEEVIIHDPHSELALTLIRNSRAEYPEKLLEKVAMELDSDVICYPDKGAVEKYQKVYPWVYIYGEKVRDQATGNITSYELVTDRNFSSLDRKKVLIVDDICDGGATFKLLAKELTKQGAIQVDLFVTHGLFTKGLQTLKESGINKIFTQDGEASEYQKQITYRRL